MDLLYLGADFLSLERIGSGQQFKTNRGSSKGSDGIQQGQDHGPQGYTYLSALLIRARICSRSLASMSKKEQPAIRQLTPSSMR